MTYHITLSAVGRRTLAVDIAGVLGIVRAVVGHMRYDLVLFSIVDDHLHVASRVEGPAALRARGLRTVVSSAVKDVELEPPHVRAIESRKHMERLVGYLLCQPRKHQLATHPALWPGSCFQDLVGARLIRGFSSSTLARELPRFRARTVLQHVGLAATPLRPASNGDLRDTGLVHLLELAAGVYGHSLPMPGLQREILAARALAAHAAELAGFKPGPIAAALGVSDRAVRRAAHRPVDPRSLQALRLRLTLERRALAALRNRQAG